MNKFLKLIFTLFVINIYGQEVNTEYLELKTKLLASNTELVIEFNTNCIGEEFIPPRVPEDCVSKRPFYLFWTNNGKYFKRKFSNCKIFMESEIENSEFINTVGKNLNEIERAEILPVLHNKKNHKGEAETITVEIDHYCISKFTIHTKDKTIIKNVNKFYLQEKMINKTTPNDNYAANQKSILKRIYELAHLESK